MDDMLIQRIKDANNIVDVVSERLTLHKAGVNYIATCPFHSDKSPSLTVSPTKQIYKCFACGAGGDVIKFVQEYDKISFFEAVKYLAARVGIELPVELDESPSEKENRKKREAAFLAMNSAQEDFLNGRSNKKFYEYLASRGIDQSTAVVFGLGYADSGFFANRITYPFYDLSGNVIGFTGRALNWMKGDNYPKYKNSSENIIFHKERTIFGIQQAKRAIADCGFVYWVEGQNDVLSLYQCGIHNVVCGSGTAFTENHAKIISRFTQNVTLLFDGDEAGHNAILKTIKILLNNNLKINVIILPEGEDPDSFAQKNNPEKLSIILQNRSIKWNNYLLQIFPYTQDNTDNNKDNIEKLLEFVAEIGDEIRRNEFIQNICNEYHQGYDVIRKRLKPIPKIDTWQNGYYGLQQAQECIKHYGGEFYITFDEEHFIASVDDIPVILWKGKPLKHIIQSLRSAVKNFYVDAKELGDVAVKENYPLSILSTLHKEYFNITVVTEEKEELLYTEYVIDKTKELLPNLTPADKSIVNSRAIELIAYSDATLRTMMSSQWAKDLQLKDAQFNKLLKLAIDKIVENSSFDKKQTLFDENTEEISFYDIPKYVSDDENLMKIYNAEGYFPMLRKDGKKCAYVFKNEKGNGHSVLSDFWMEPLLHIYSTDKQNNKRVLQLLHRNPGVKDKYVEWPSSTLTTLNNIEDQLINEGAYNFKGTAYQYKSLRAQLLYGFTLCEDIETYGYHKNGFWAFANAIYHQVKDPTTGIIENKIDYTDNLGVVNHEGKNYYSPACSEIFIENSNSQLEQDRFLIYKEIPERDRIDFAQWASLMNEVYKINDNGKWAILFDVMCCFRDFIYDIRRCFTTLFFIGPTGSGKSQIAYSMRSLFMSPDAPVFNLNSGTNAAFWLIMARYRNVIAIMEEYNDTNIHEEKFQGLKSAVFDGEGRMKVGNAGAKQIDSSKVNAIPLLLGQEAPQRDDGSLANRSIICEVPNKRNFSDHEIEIFEKLKRHEKIGLSNILIEIISLRNIFVSKFNIIYTAEEKLLRRSVSNLQMSDGLTRILNSVAMFTTICRIIVEHTNLKLPFTYDEFYKLAVNKITKQVESISSSNKLATYFNIIAYLLSKGEIIYGKEFKVDSPRGNSIVVKTSGDKTENKLLEPGTRLLYLHFEGIYTAYAKYAGKDALTRMSLQNYILANQAFIGKVNSTRFTYYIDTIEDKVSSLSDEPTPTHKTKKVTNNTSAYVFDYDVICTLMDIDLLQSAATIEDDDIKTNSDAEMPVPF